MNLSLLSQFTITKDTHTLTLLTTNHIQYYSMTTNTFLNISNEHLLYTKTILKFSHNLTATDLKINLACFTEGSHDTDCRAVHVIVTLSTNT